MDIAPANPSNFYHYNKKYKNYANYLRNHMTKSEVYVWKYLLRSSTFRGFKFRRQRPILNYIVDFCCFELMLVIEIDGIHHETEIGKMKDRNRDINLKSIGFDVLRFKAFDVLEDIHFVERSLSDWLVGKKLAETSPLPPQEGDGFKLKDWSQE